ncbi:GIY-YIG nuclease family protein [Vibrio parahaemolyticus]|uniref:GIY-YIG nuclease family protein n=1 Tax=Vibrio parahaemolyticus TaxID=670 RepID=UPI0004A459E5
MIKIVDLNSIKISRNNYDFLCELKNRYGVYIFFDPNTGSTLYIGEAREQDLKKRCTQNFAENDNGGTFKNNYMKFENKTYSEFIDQVQKIKLLFIACESNIAVRALESLLILLLKPRFNKDT